MAEQELIKVEVAALVEDQASSSPIVILRDVQTDRLLPIWIGDPEARAIAISLNKMSVPRPMTHQLLLNVIGKIGGKLSSVVIDGLKNNTYFASLYIEIGEKFLQIDARPSDAIALALQAGMPVFVDKVIMDRSSQPNPFKDLSLKQEKRETKSRFCGSDFEKLKLLLEKARQREQESF